MADIKKTSLIFALPGNEELAQRLSELMAVKIGKWDHRRFPDREFYLRIESEVRGNSAFLVSSLNDPDEKIASLVFLSSTLRELGAKKVILVAPYLAYLRQDRRFRDGEGVTSKYFARLISEYFDGIITVDPHLHRYSSLNEVYSIPAMVVHAAPEISDWIRKKFANPLIVGPDLESEQWVSQVAKGANAPYLVLEKVRKADRKVEIHFPSMNIWNERTPVIVDDIISSAKTMIAIVEQLRKLNYMSIVCIGIHAIFEGSSYDELLAVGAGEVVTCNTINHVSNQIDLCRILAEAIKDFSSFECLRGQ